MGASGSGKTEAGLVLVAETVTRHDATVIYVDPVKGVQSIFPVAAGVSWAATDRTSAKHIVGRIPAMINARTNHLGRNGFKQWQPGCGLKYLVIVIEEAAAIIGNPKFVQLTEQARSAGISLVVSLQRASHDRMPTSARYNIGSSICFGVGDDISAGFALTDTTLDAGATPWLWKDRRPGMAYLEAPGVDESRWPTPLRHFLTNPDDLKTIIAHHAQPGLDEVTADAAGNEYTKYRAAVANGTAPWQQTTGMATVTPIRPAAVHDEDDDVDDLDDDTDDYDDEDSDDFTVPASPEPHFMPDIDATTDIEPDNGPSIDLTVPAPTRATAEQAREALARLIADMAAAGHDTVQPAQLVEFRHSVGRSAPWLSAELRRLVDAGQLDALPERGLYALRQDPAA